MLSSAVKKITREIVNDQFVHAIYEINRSKTATESMSSNLEIDLYCVVKNEHLAEFMSKRKNYLESYAPILYWTESFHVHSMIVAVFNTGLHFNLYAVKENMIRIEEEIKVLYDPENILERYLEPKSESPLFDSDSYFDEFLLLFLLLGFKTVYHNKDKEKLKEKMDLRSSFELDYKTLDMLKKTKGMLNQLSSEIITGERVDDVFFNEMAVKMKAHNIASEENKIKTMIKEMPYYPTEKYQIAEKMLKHFHTKDNDLRENYIKKFLNEWLLTHQFTAIEQNKILFQCIKDDYLFYKIDQEDGEEVRITTLSVLVSLLKIDNEKSFVSEDNKAYVAERLIAYLIKENRLCQSEMIVNYCSLICALIDWKFLTEVDEDLSIMCVKKPIFNESYCFAHDEEEHIANLILKITQKSKEAYKSVCNMISEIESSPQSQTIKRNMKLVWQSLFFKLQNDPLNVEMYEYVKANICRK